MDGEGGGGGRWREDGGGARVRHQQRWSGSCGVRAVDSRVCRRAAESHPTPRAVWGHLSRKPQHELLRVHPHRGCRAHSTRFQATSGWGRPTAGRLPPARNTHSGGGSGRGGTRWMHPGLRAHPAYPPTMHCQRGVRGRGVFPCARRRGSAQTTVPHWRGTVRLRHPIGR